MMRILLMNFILLSPISLHADCLFQFHKTGSEAELIVENSSLSFQPSGADASLEECKPVDETSSLWSLVVMLGSAGTSTQVATTELWIVDTSASEAKVVFKKEILVKVDDKIKMSRTFKVSKSKQTSAIQIELNNPKELVTLQTKN